MLKRMIHDIKYLFTDEDVKNALNKLYGAEILTLNRSSMHYYRTRVQGNMNISDKEVMRKMTRNMIMAVPYIPENCKEPNGRQWYSYGRLQFAVRNNEVIWMKNYAPVHSKWRKNEKVYDRLNRELGIEGN